LYAKKINGPLFGFSANPRYPGSSSITLDELSDGKEASVSAEQHHDTSQNWLVFFFICFGIVLLGIVALFARNVNDEPQKPSSGGGHSMILPTEIKSSLSPVV
jgi:hypothetical protein